MRTFVFGAGASVHAGYPLAPDLWRAIERWVLATCSEGHNFRSAVDTMNAEFDVSKSFELVLTDLDNRIQRLLNARPTTTEAKFEKFKFVYLPDILKSIIRFYFDSLRSEPAELYRVFADDVLAEGDAVITFNYDLAIDRELKRSGKWSIGNGYGFTIDRAAFGDSPCKLFKLHGSTNWRGELFQGATGFSQGDLINKSIGLRPVIDRSEFEYLGYSDAWDPRCHNGQIRIESVVLPTLNKRFFNETSLGREWESFWDSLWFQAGDGLAHSDEVHIIGYSVPEFDARARELLGAKIGDGARVSVCCRRGTSTVIESLRQLTRSRRVDVGAACSDTFDDWVSCTNLG
ncbi:MAG: hypothetical protein WBL70_18295 [Candidatus Acidiferrales bacterium]